MASKSETWSTNYNFVIFFLIQANQVFSVLNEYIEIEQSANLIERILVIIHKIVSNILII